MRKNRRTDRYKDTATGTSHAFQCVDNSLFSRQKYIHTLSIYMSKKTEHNLQSIYVHRRMRPRERTVASIRLGPCKMLRCRISALDELSTSSQLCHLQGVSLRTTLFSSSTSFSTLSTTTQHAKPGRQEKIQNRATNIHS